MDFTIIVAPARRDIDPGVTGVRSQPDTVRRLGGAAVRFVPAPVCDTVYVPDGLQIQC